MKKMLSVIVPCYNEEKALPLFIKELYKVTESCLDEKMEVILVNDGSADGTFRYIKSLAKQDDRVKYISFSRNFGKEAAIYAGLSMAKGDYCVLMDADMQDPPSMLPKMLDIMRTGEYDSVATRCVTRKGEPPIRSFFARRFYAIMNKIADVELVDGARDYRLMNRKFVDGIVSLREYNRFSKGLFGWIGYKTKWLEFENKERIAGETKWSFWSLFKYSVEGIVAFSTMPLVIASALGIACLVVALLAIVFIIARKLMFGDPVDGWASIVCIITFIGGLQLFCMGIMGEYLAKTYLETKKRPVFVIDETNMEPVDVKMFPFQRN